MRSGFLIVRHDPEYLAEKLSGLAGRFHDKSITETVYRASVYALGFRLDAIDEIVKPQLEIFHGNHPNAADISPAIRANRRGYC